MAKDTLGSCEHAPFSQPELASVQVSMVANAKISLVLFELHKF